MFVDVGTDAASTIVPHSMDIHEIKLGKIKLQKLIKMYQSPPKLFFVLVVLLVLVQKIMFSTLLLLSLV